MNGGKSAMGVGPAGSVGTGVGNMNGGKQAVCVGFAGSVGTSFGIMNGGKPAEGEGFVGSVGAGFGSMSAGRGAALELKTMYMPAVGTSDAAQLARMTRLVVQTGGGCEGDRELR